LADQIAGLENAGLENNSNATSRTRATFVACGFDKLLVCMVLYADRYGCGGAGGALGD